jgi:hypothetical protein
MSLRFIDWENRRKVKKGLHRGMESRTVLFIVNIT